MTDSIKVTASGKSGGIEIKEIPLDLLDPTDWNPNELSKDKFNMLFDNMAEEGILEPFVVVPKEDGRYKVVGGHHRLEVAKLLGIKTGPCVIKHGYDEDKVKFQNMRLNVIHGKINAEKFTKLYEEMQAKYPDRDLAYEFGIVSPDELEKMLVSTKKSLPPEMQEAFEEASKEVKTVEDLVLVLNELFEKQAATVEKYHYMILDFEGKQSIWVRMSKKELNRAKEVAQQCFVQSVAMDDVINGLFDLLLKMSPEEKEKFFYGMEKVGIGDLDNKFPTKEVLDEQKES